MNAAAIVALPSAEYPRLIKATDSGNLFLIPSGKPGSEATRVVLLDENDQLDASAVPDLIDCRLKIAGSAPVDMLNATPALQDYEVFVDSVHDQLCYGFSDGSRKIVSDPAYALDMSETCMGTWRNDTIIPLEYEYTMLRLMFLSPTLTDIAVAVGGGATHARPVRWDNTYGSLGPQPALPADGLVLSGTAWGAAPTSVYGARTPKILGVMPCDASGNPVRGSYVQSFEILGSSPAVVAVDFDSLRNLKWSNIVGNPLRGHGKYKNDSVGFSDEGVTLDGTAHRRLSTTSWLRNLPSLWVSNAKSISELESVNSSGQLVTAYNCPKLQRVRVGANTSLILQSLPAYTTFIPDPGLEVLHITSLSAITSLAFSVQTPNLRGLVVTQSAALTSVNLTGARSSNAPDGGGLEGLTVTSCASLSSVNFGDLKPTLKYDFWADIRNNTSMSAVAINAMFETLPQKPQGLAHTWYIRVAGCGGADTCDMSLAYSRGWTPTIS